MKKSGLKFCPLKTCVVKRFSCKTLINIQYCYGTFLFAISGWSIKKKRKYKYCYAYITSMEERRKSGNITKRPATEAS